MVTNISDFCKSELARQIPGADRKALISLLKASYNLRNKVSLDNPVFYCTEIGSKDIQADLLRAAIAAVAVDYCSRGILPYKCCIEKNTVRNCSHVELHNNESTIYLARTSFAGQKPKYVKYIPYNEPNLFDPVPAPEKDVITTFLLTYGDSSTADLDFAVLGVPGSKGWYYKENLSISNADIYTISAKEPEEMLISLIENGAIANEQ